jgi:hypothetical protein
MKTRNLLTVLILCGVHSGNLLAQPSSNLAKDKMQQFVFWEGQWKGEASTQMGPGPSKKSTVDETLQFKLDGTIMLIEGIGKSIDPQTNQSHIVHHAMAILSFDQATNQYKFQTYLKDGRSTPALLKVIEENKYEWGFDTPNGKIKYVIIIDPAKRTWHEVGEFSNDNAATWIKFFEMNLKKV